MVPSHLQSRRNEKEIWTPVCLTPSCALSRHSALAAQSTAPLAAARRAPALSRAPHVTGTQNHWPGQHATRYAEDENTR